MSSSSPPPLSPHLRPPFPPPLPPPAREYLEQQPPPSELATNVKELARSDTPAGPTTAVSNQTAVLALSEKPQVLEPSSSNRCGLGVAFCCC